MPPIDDATLLVLKHLKRELRLHGTLREVAAILGVGYRYLLDLLQGKNPMSLQFFLKIATTFRVSLPAQFRSQEELFFDRPVEILLAQRQKAQQPTNAFLGRLKKRIDAVLASDVDPMVRERSVLPALMDLEEQRFGDRWAAQSGAQKLALQLLRDLEAARGLKPGGAMADLAATLALWATIQRSRGFYDFAVKAFTLAFPLAQKSGDHWALGCCYQRAAYLLRDCDRPELGTGFIHQAIGNFGSGATQLDIWKCLMDRGCMLSSEDKLQAANSDYEASLRLLPGSEWRFRVGALQGLGANLQRQGLPEQARDVLAEALKECRKDDLVLGHIKWASARVEVDLAQVDKALRLFHEATELLARFGSAADVALVCLDHAELLMSVKRQESAVQIISGVARWLPKLRANPILCRAFDKFLDLARAARIGSRDFEKTRTAVREAWKLGESLLPA